MKFYIIIPAHNEDKTIGLMLNSLVKQTKHPKKIVVVNDNSDDNTEKIISQFLPPTCRFSPSCSNYMLQAINQLGVGKGIILGIKRIFKCHPFSKTSGWDPVK